MQHALPKSCRQLRRVSVHVESKPHPQRVVQPHEVSHQAAVMLEDCAVDIANTCAADALAMHLHVRRRAVIL